MDSSVKMENLRSLGECDDLDLHGGGSLGPYIIANGGGEARKIPNGWSNEGKGK